eukprot:SAG31_NODE_2845_length_5009_cov_1.983299_1_plen_98_part_00
MLSPCLDRANSLARSGRARLTGVRCRGLSATKPSCLARALLGRSAPWGLAAALLIAPLIIIGPGGGGRSPIGPMGDCPAGRILDRNRRSLNLDTCRY